MRAMHPTPAHTGLRARAPPTASRAPRASRRPCRLSCVLLTLLLLSCLSPQAPAFSFRPPPKKRGKSGPPDTNPYVETIEQRISDGTKALHVRAFVKLPDFKGVGSKIVGMTSYDRHLYVTTSTSGAYIYRIDVRTKRYRRWFALGRQVVRDTKGERAVNCENAAHGGLRGVAFPPDFDRTGLFYTSYVETPPKNRRKFRYITWPKRGSRTPDSVVIEWQYNFTTKAVVPGSYRSVIRIPVPVFDHPIKQIVFQGRNLLITHGDASVQSGLGGGGMNNDGLGKVLRIDPRVQKNGAPYRVPRDNPFVGWPKYPDEVYALGFRNPHNICVSAKRKGLVFVTDAGRDNAEEVNLLVRGNNYGWPKREGTFVHLDRGGTGTGIAKLPAWDAGYRFRYPVVQLGHYARNASVFQGQAIAGGCPIENGSPLSGTYWYANFPSSGQMYYSWVREMRRAKTKGPPRLLRTARVFRAKVVFHRKGKRPVRLENFLGVLRYDGYNGATRADIRFGRGPRGEMYVSSKTSGKIYVVITSVPRWK